MKSLVMTFITLFCAANLLAQDGGDICFVKVADINESDQGKFVHLDFGERSFLRPGEERKIEEVTLVIKGQEVVFREHIMYDHFNSWWDKQYLESVKPFQGRTLRITKFLLQQVLDREINVKAYFQYFDAEDRPTEGPLVAEVLSIPKNRIVEVLFKIGSNEPCPPRAAGDS